MNRMLGLALVADVSAPAGEAIAKTTRLAPIQRIACANRVSMLGSDLGVTRICSLVASKLPWASHCF